MKRKFPKILDVAIHSINLILINYALSNMMAFFRSSLLYILFFTSEMWVFVQYRKSIETLSNSKTLANLLLVICAAIEDLNSGRVKDEHTMHAYLLMMMQPFMTMDDLSVSVLSDKDKADLYKIADALPKEMDGLAKKLHLDKQRLSDMPMLMMKIYVTRL